MRKSGIYKLLILLFITVSVYGQESIRLMTYNVLNYHSTSNPTKDSNLKKIIGSVNPDILVIQEVDGSYYVNKFYNNVLDSTYSKAAFIDGYDTDNAMYFRDSLFQFISNVAIHTDLRDISKFTLVYKSTNDTLIVYSLHLKAGKGKNESERKILEQQRANEVESLRKNTDALPPGTNYVVLGDFNIYSSSEPAYQKLIDKSKPGYFLDPVAAGNWHNNSGFAAIHTQSTRTTSLSDDGSTGGLDDRFDMILYSEAVKDSAGIFYVPGSYTVFGNDGNHFNKSINEGTNSAVNQDVANALYYASDHLPVFADFVMNPVVSVKDDYKIAGKFILYQNYPNPFNPATVIKYTIPTPPASSPLAKGKTEVGFVTLKIYDVLGREIKTLVNEEQSPGTYTVTFNAKSTAGGLPSGIYFYQLRAGSFVQTRKMILMK